MTEQRMATEILSDVEYYKKLLRMALRVQEEDVSQWQEKLAMIAVDDLPRALEAAAKLRAVIIETRSWLPWKNGIAKKYMNDVADILDETDWLEENW